MNAVIENLLTRRSIRKFKDEPVSRSDLEIILKTGIYAPSGMNMQTMRLTAVTDKEKIKQLAELVGKNLGRDDYDFYKPSVIIIPSNERESRWGVEDNACAMENMFLAAHSLGIGSVWINQLRELCDVPEIRAMLREWQIPDDHVVYGMISLGYPYEDIALSLESVEKKGIINIIE